MNLPIILIGILVAALLAVTPLGLRYNSNWSYAPSGGIAILLLVLISLIARGWI